MQRCLVFKVRAFDFLSRSAHLLLFPSLFYCGCGGVTEGNLGRHAYLLQQSDSRFSMASPKLISSSVVPGSDKVEIDSRIIFTFDMPLNSSQIDSNTIRIRRSDTGELLQGDVRYANNSIEFQVDRRFLMKSKSDGSMETVYSGLKAELAYAVQFGTLFGEDGSQSPDSGKLFSFRTVQEDHGIYWLGENGEYEKFRPGIQSKYFDPLRPTVLHLHGWQKGTSQYDMQRENVFVYTGSPYGNANVIGKWRNKGYNVGEYFWNQIADEQDIRDAETKVWLGESGTRSGTDGTISMRYRLRNGNFVSMPAEKNVTTMFVDEYMQAFADYQGSGVRLTGHSLGAQIAEHAIYLLAKSADEGKIANKIVPTRLALLDPFWSKGGKAYLDGKSTAEVSSPEILGVVSSRNLVVEQVKTSLIGGIVVGDENLPLRKVTAFARVLPKFIPQTDMASLHLYSYVWYLNSIERLIPTSSGPLGAAAPDAEIWAKMNFSHGANPVYWKQVAGSDSPKVDDDRFEDVSGVETW